MIISSESLTRADLGLEYGSIGDYILKAMKDQRKENIMCDAIIKCGNKEFPVHKTLLYAYSLYCRKLFSGSFPPKKKDGIILIDLDCFSQNVVSVFLNIIYGDQGEDVFNIEIEELIKLFDFLQADSDIDIMTNTLRGALDIDNCVELYKLAGAYNFNKLQAVAVTYISRNLRKVMKSNSWKRIDEKTLVSLLKHPSIQCKSDTLVGEAFKSHCCGNASSDILMGIDMTAECTRTFDMHFYQNKDVLTIKRDLTNDAELTLLYFVFQRELYCLRQSNSGTMQLWRYYQYSKSYGMICHSIELKKPSTVYAIVDQEEKDMLTLVCIPRKMAGVDVGTKQFSLVKLSITSSAESHKIRYINTPFKVQDYRNIVYNPQSRSIFFFRGSVAREISMESECLVANHVISNPIEEDTMCYVEFGGYIYLVTHDNTNLRMYVFNGVEDYSMMACCWDLYLEQELKMDVYCIKACSSHTELSIIIERINEFSECDMDLIYKLDPDSKTLTHVRNCDVRDKYLFVPDYIYF